MIDLDELRKIAENATPGPWEAETWEPFGFEGELELGVVNHAGGELWDTSGRNCTSSASDAEFIAAFNPETVLALLDRVETAEQELGRYDRRLERTESEYSRLETSHSILERALQRVRELHRECDIYRETCAGCSVGENLIDWPCPTIRALEGDE